jgi:hypothetical protein
MSAGQTFNSLFGAPLDNGGHTLGNGTSFDAIASPTSPNFVMDGTMGPPSLGGGLLRNPRGPPADAKGFGSRPLRSLGGSNGNLRVSATTATGVIGGQRPLSSSAGAAYSNAASIGLKSDSTSVHTNTTSGSSSSVIEEEGEVSEGQSDFSARR